MKYIIDAKSISGKVPRTPCYVVDKGALEHNLRILDAVQSSSGCSIVLALKGFSMFGVFPIIKKYLSGIAASSLNEARLGYEEFGKDVHLTAPAYRPDEFDELMRYSSHIVFNSFSQWGLYKEKVLSSGKKIHCGLRINPEHSEVKVKIYDPCAPGSRLGIKRRLFNGMNLDGITGLHFHNLCELNSDALERTLRVVDASFGTFIQEMEWVNFGGGHHITRPDYDVERLCRIVKEFREKYGVKVYMEPGEAIALNTGVMVASVLDILKDKPDIAILDTSAAAHMPDVLEMPYRPEVDGAGRPGERKHTYKFGGMTCLAGDIIGEYSFDVPLKVGDRVVFMDMAHYTMVKNNTFNGINLPSIAVYDPTEQKVDVLRNFGYEDYRNRLS